MQNSNLSCLNGGIRCEGLETSGTVLRHPGEIVWTKGSDSCCGFRNNWNVTSRKQMLKSNIRGRIRGRICPVPSVVHQPSIVA